MQLLKKISYLTVGPNFMKLEAFHLNPSHLLDLHGEGGVAIKKCVGYVQHTFHCKC